MAILGEVNMQSTGQGGPEVNRDFEVLFNAMKAVIRSNNDMQATLSSLTGGSTGSPSAIDGTPASGGTATGGLADVVDEAPVVLAGNAGPVTTEDAWTTIASGAPNGATIAIIQGYMFSSDDDAGGTITVRTASGQPERVIAIVRADGTSDADRAGLTAWFPIKLSSGSLDYKADTASGAVGWEVRRIGYL